MLRLVMDVINCASSMSLPFCSEAGDSIYFFEKSAYFYQTAKCHKPGTVVTASNQLVVTVMKDATFLQP